MSIESDKIGWQGQRSRHIVLLGLRVNDRVEGRVKK